MKTSKQKLALNSQVKLSRWPQNPLRSAGYFHLGKPPYSTAKSAAVIPIWGEATNSSTAWCRILDLGELAESIGWLGNTCVHSSAPSVTLQQLWNNSGRFKAEGAVFSANEAQPSISTLWYEEAGREWLCLRCTGSQCYTFLKQPLCAACLREPPVCAFRKIWMLKTRPLNKGLKEQYSVNLNCLCKTRAYVITVMDDYCNNVVMGQIK